MKKILTILLVLFSFFSLFGAVSDPACRAQMISGFIDDISYLYVSPFSYDRVTYNGYKGVNLDYSDSDNEIRGLIMPASDHYPGISIGTFSVMCTFIEAAHYDESSIPAVKLTITHTKLVHTTKPNVQLEYELAVRYAVNGGSDLTTLWCLSSDSTGSDPKKIEINLTSLAVNHLVSIQNANIYFRFANVNGTDEKPTEIGQYESGIVFTLEGR